MSPNRSKSDNPLLNLLNSSGFIFQVGVRREVERTFNEHAWVVLWQERGWQHSDQERSGFADLVLEQPFLHSRIVIECKRASGKDWVFLIPQGYETSATRISSFWIQKSDLIGETENSYAWLDPDVYPESPESAFCIVQGQEDGKTPMLERICDVLLPATEALALKDKPFLHRFYFPVIVTNANLYVCEFDPGDVCMKDGRLPDGKGKFELKEVVRFRKALANRLEPSRDLESFVGFHNMENQEKREEQTVLIVNASSLSNILRDFRLIPNTMDSLTYWLKMERIKGEQGQ